MQYIKEKCEHEGTRLYMKQQNLLVTSIKDKDVECNHEEAHAVK